MKTITILYFLLLALPSISHAENMQNSNAILVTLPPLAGLATMLLPATSPQCLLKKGADPHHFQLKPKQVNALNQTRLLIRSPQDDKHWSSFNMVSNTIALWDIQKHIHQETNHAWLNPHEVSSALPKLAQALTRLFPMDSDNIKLHLHDAKQLTQDVWRQWQDFVEENNLKQRGVMMQHPSWHGLFEALGVPIRGVLESAQHGQEYGPRKLEEALLTLQKYPKTILIGDRNHSNRALLWLQKHSLHRFTKLDALGRCGEPWEDLMQRNLSALNVFMEAQP